MPALRERQEDVGVLADAILQRLAQRSGLEGVPQLSSMALRYLQSYPFPGNVRELENILERALAFSDGRVINVEDLGLRPIVTDEKERELDDSLHQGLAAPGGMHPGQGALAAAPWAAGQGASVSDGGVDEGQGTSSMPAAGEPRGWKLIDGVPTSLPDYLDQVERDAILLALERTGQNRTAAARLLGITFRALRYRLQRLGI